MSKHQLLSHFGYMPAWEKILPHQRHGINVPLSALHTQRSCGIGAFLDLLPLIDWCQEVGMGVIQLLPLNDSGEDPSPYNAISSCALHPIYISLDALPDIPPHLSKQLDSLRLLNASPCVEYKKVLKLKMAWLRSYFELGDKAYVDFLESHPWVQGYALFKSLQDRFPGKSWRDWPHEFLSLSGKDHAHLEGYLGEDFGFFIWLQKICFAQWAEVKKYAEERAIMLMGDIPILISRTGSDSFLHSELFDFQFHAGAPPDMYIEEGQDWGFPIMRWDVMKTQGYKWWKERLRFATPLYDLYRIDHVVGLFRIWGIALGKKAHEGQFIPEDKTLWPHAGREILEVMLKSSPLLPVAEDLGTVPDCVRPILEELGICTTKVVRWERFWDTDLSFIPYEKYPYFSLTTLSTHDSETVALWWRDQPEEARRFATWKGWHYEPFLFFEQKQEILWDSHHTASLLHINLLQEYCALFPDLVWPLLEKERINIPGRALSTNWSYKFFSSLETFVRHEPLKKVMRYLVTSVALMCTQLYGQQNLALKALYSSLNPLSLSQHLAFYQLYPESDEGRQALHDTWQLLRGDPGSFTELPSCSLEAFTSLVSGKASSVAFTQEQLELISILSQDLHNRKLLGSKVLDSEALCALPDDQIDVGRAILLQENSDESVIARYEALLDLMALHIRARLADGALPEEKVRIINEFIFEEMRFRFPPHSLHVQDIDLYTFLPSVLDSRQGVCLGVSVLYLCLGQRLGLPLEIITPPGHIYVRIKDSKGCIVNIETTARGIDLPSERYLGINTRLLQQRTLKEVIGMVFINQASVYWNRGAYTETLIAYKKAEKYLSHDPLLQLFMGLNYLFVGEEDKARTLLTPLRGYIFEEAVSKETMPEDYLLGHADAKALEVIFLPVDETRQSILTKQAKLLSVLERCPKFRAGILQLATTWLQLGRTREALEVLERYNTLDPSDATVSYYLAALYLRRLDYTKAWHFLVQAEALTEKRSHFPEALKELRHSLRRFFQ